ncbi:MAG: hypothetical protein ABSD59_24895 [Terracidiphilus sp.]
MDPSTKVDFEGLFDEKNLTQIFSLAPSFVSNPFNVFIASTTAFLLLVFSIAHICIPSLREAVRFPFADTFSIWANAGASLAGSILGFLIAGFAIICTILRPGTILNLQRLHNPKYKLSELKLLFVIFVDVFVQYLALLFWSLLVVIFGGKTGPAMMLGIFLSKINWMIPFCLLHVILVAWGTWLVMLVLSLKSFIYNLYQSLALALVDSADDFQRGL